VRDHGFATTTHDRIVALVRPVNLPSQGVARRLGMRPAGLITYSDLAHVIFAVERPVPEAHPARVPPPDALRAAPARRADAGP